MLKVKHLHKYYHNFAQKPLHVINDTSIEIPETGIIAVVGASGAGKTTLINTISGLDSFKSGSIAFDDTEMKHYNTHIADKMRMKNYGFIFQNYYLLEKQTVYENVKVSLDAFDISESEKKKRVTYVLNQLGIAKYTNKLVTSLSGGEQQRVSIARALVKSPKIIFADEPTGSLDEITTFNVLNIFKQISKNCAVFIVTHERDIISYYADYIIEIENGVVVKEFSPTLDNEKTLSIDQNIYLDELEHKDHHELENLSIDFYTDDTSKEKADVKIAVRNGKIYLESSSNITILDKKSENHLLSGQRKKIKDYVKEDFDFELEPLTYNNNKFGFKEIIKKAYRNFKSKRKTKAILKVMCVALSVLTLGLVEGFNTLETIDISTGLQNSKGNIYLNISADSMEMRTIQVYDAMTETATSIIRSDLPGTLFFEPSDRFLFKYEGLSQIKNQQFTLPSNDFKDINTFDESTLVYGSMPKNGYEVVIDEYVLSKLVKDTVLSEIAADYGYFVGKTFASSVYNYSITIAGVCRTRNPVIYGYEGLVFARLESVYRVRVIDIDYAKQIYPQFKDVTLEQGHCLKNVSATSTTLSHLIVDGEFSDLPYDNIVSKKEFDYMKVNCAGSKKRMYIQTDGSQEVIDAYGRLFSRVVSDLKNRNIDVKIEIEHPYATQRAEALANLNNIMNYVKIVAYVVMALALILVILSTYLSMLNQISDIAVYRSLGYSRSFLGLIYLFELGLLAFIYSFIGGAVTYLAMLLMDVMPLVSYSIATPFWLVILSILAIPLAIMIIGMIPIMLVFRLTPASIYTRYNRKINNE